MIARSPATTSRRASRPAASLALLGAGVALFAIHASLYRDWLIDDSGISIAYAIHWASGHGLVSQPGLPPIEGYSNPLWVLVLAALSRIRLLVLPLAPKLASGALVAVAYAAMLSLVEQAAARRRIVGALVLAACSMNPAVVIWCTSGLENALYVATIATLASFTARTAESARKVPMTALCGFLASLPAITRPDGLVFAFVPPIVLLSLGVRKRRAFSAYAAAFMAVYGTFIGARVATFGALVPNTALVKGGPRLSDAIDFVLLTRAGLDKLMALLESAFPAPVTTVAFVGTVVGVVLSARRRELRVAHATLLAYALAALADYMLMPADWMHESRFGTTFLVFYYATAFAFADLALAGTSLRRKNVGLAVVLGTFVLAALPAFAGRALAFARSPNIDLFFVRRAFAERFDRYAAALEVATPSVLLPDVGGMLLYSHARVYDLAGLCDASIARLASRDVAAERDYILYQARPTFIHTYGRFSRMALESDPRFASDYSTIHAYSSQEDPDQGGHASGIFVRRDAVTSPQAEARLDAIRRETHDRLALVPEPRRSALLRWLEQTTLVPLEYRAASSTPAIGQEGLRPTR